MEQVEWSFLENFFFGYRFGELMIY